MSFFCKRTLSLLTTSAYETTKPCNTGGQKLKQYGRFVHSHTLNSRLFSSTPKLQFLGCRNRINVTNFSRERRRCQICVTTCSSVSRHALATTTKVEDLPKKEVKTKKKQLKQAMDFTTIVAVVEEIKRDWLPAKIEQVIQVDSNTLVLGLRTLHRQGWLHLSWHPSAARLCMGGPPEYRPDADVFSFGEAMRKYVRGLALIQVSMSAWERVVSLDLAARPQDNPTRQIVIEVMGQRSNLIACTPQGEVLSCAFQVGLDKTRPLAVGGMYSLPPPAEGLEPSQEESQPQWAANVRQSAATSWNRSVNMGMVRAYKGVSPALANELMLCAHLEPNMEAEAMTADDWARLHFHWLRWLETLIGEEGDFAAGTLVANKLTSVLFIDGLEGVYKAKQEADVEDLDAALAGGQNFNSLATVSPINAMVDDYFSNLVAAEKFQQLHTVLLTKLRTRVKKLGEKVADFKQRLEASEECEVPQEQGHLLLAYKHQYTKGADKLEVTDFTTGETFFLPVDPRKGVTATAQALYKRSQKLRRSSAAILPLLAQAEEELEYVSSVEMAVEQAAEGSAKPVQKLQVVQEIKAELQAAGYVKVSAAERLAASKPGGGKKKKKRQQEKEGQRALAGVRRLRAPSGKEVLVGRNNKGNEVVSHQLASPNDLWFHVRGIPGSHTLLRLQAGDVAEDEDVQFAADVSAYYSKARNLSDTAVDIVSPKHIRRAKGGRLGMVTISKNASVDTIWARPNDVEKIVKGEDEE